MKFGVLGRDKITSATSFAVFSMSDRQHISTGVCIYRDGMETKDAAMPLRLIWSTSASVAVAPGSARLDGNGRLFRGRLENFSQGNIDIGVPVKNGALAELDITE